VVERRAQRDLLDQPRQPERDDREQHTPEKDAVERVGEGVEELRVHLGRQLLRLLGAQVDAAGEVLLRLGRKGLERAREL
jgi:hypothetical protein